MGASTARIYEPRIVLDLLFDHRGGTDHLVGEAFRKFLDEVYDPYAWKHPDGSPAKVLIERNPEDTDRTSMYTSRKFAIFGCNPIQEPQMHAWENMAKSVFVAITEFAERNTTGAMIEMSVTYTTATEEKRISVK